MRMRHGFTLIEVMVAVAVLGIAFTALFGLFSKSISNLRKIDDIRKYQLAGEDLLKRVQFLSKVPADGRAQGVFEKIGAQWKVAITPWLPNTLESKPAEAIVKIDVEVSWPGQATRRSLRLETVKPATIEYENYDFNRAIEDVFPR